MAIGHVLPGAAAGETITLIEEGDLERQVGMGCPLAPRVVLLFKCGAHKVPANNLLVMLTTLPKISAVIAAVTSKPPKLCMGASGSYFTATEGMGDAIV